MRQVAVKSHGTLPSASLEVFVFIRITKSDRHLNVRETAVKQIASRWSYLGQTLPFLKSLVESEQDSHLLSVLVRELCGGRPDDAETLPWLKLQLRCYRRSEDAVVRQAAVQELARNWPDNAETWMLLEAKAEGDESPAVRQMALQKLARGGTDESQIFEWLKTGSSR